MFLSLHVIQIPIWRKLYLVEMLKFIFVFLLNTTVCFAQRGKLLSDPSHGPDTFRVFKYSDTIFNDYQSYPDVKAFLNERFPFRYVINNSQFIGIANEFFNIKKTKGSTKRMKAGFFHLTNSKGVLSIRDSYHAQFENDSLTSLLIGGGYFGSLSFKNSKVNHLAIVWDTLRSLHVHDSLTTINRLTIYHSFIEEIAINYLADTLELINFRS
jgi:hypothetical protein